MEENVGTLADLRRPLKTIHFSDVICESVKTVNVAREQICDCEM